MGTTSECSDGGGATAAAVSSSAGVKRYPPWLQKALRVKEQSERFWTQQQRRQEASDTRQEPPQQELSPATQPLPAGHSSVWDAIAAHDAGFVKEFIESEPQRLFCRWEGISVGGGGVTLLHKAVAHGALEIVALLLRVLQSRFPSETCRKFINNTDTFGSKTTPLIAACRSSEGMMSQRLEVVRLLVHADSDVSLQDAHGDNVLHWCARESHTLLLRFFLKETDAGVAAIFAENYKREKPLDIAKRQLSHKPSMKTTTAFNLLRSVDRKCNIRMKLQVLRRFRSVEQAETRAQQRLQLQAALGSTNVLLDKADQFWNDALQQAERHRQSVEDAYIATAAQSASRAASEWLETKDGKLYLKKQLPVATQELKVDVQMGRVPKPKDLKKAALERVQQTLCREKESAARRQAADNFRAKTPAYPRESDTPPEKLLRAALRIQTS
ncbi:hypothetical protein Gpo141_00004354 [Globisporangium polare]